MTALLAGGLALPAVPAAAADPAAPSVTAAVSTATLPSSSTAALVYPLVVVGPAPTHVDVDQVTSAGAAVEPSVARAVTARVGARVLTLDVQADQVPAQGTYSVLLAVTTDGDPFPLTVSFVRPAATLSGPTSLSVVRTVGPRAPWLEQLLQQPDTDPATTTLRAASGRLLTVTTAPQEAAAPQVTASATVDADAQTVSVTATTHQGALGTVTRTVELVSPQLGAPTTLTVEVRNRLSLLWIAVVLGGALLVGLLVRAVLPKVVAAVGRSARRTHVEQQLRAVRELVRDKDVRAVVDAQEARVSTWFVRSSAVDDAARKVEAALVDLEDRTTEQDRRLRRLEDALRPRAGVLTDVATDLHTARARLTLARADLRSRDAASAVDRIDEALRLAVDVGRRTADALRAADVSTLQAALGGRTAGASGRLAARLAVLADRLAVPDEDATADEKARVDRLAAVLDRAHIALQSVRDGVLPAVVEVADEADRAADRIALGDPDGTAGVVATIRAAARGLRAYGSAAPTLRFEEPAREVAALFRAYGEVLTLIHPAGAEQAAAQAFLDDGDVPRSLQKQGAHLGGPGGAGASPAGPSSTTDPVPATPHLDQIPVRTGIWLAALPARAATSAFGFLGFLVHTAIALLLVLVSGYALFGPQWDGTYTQMFQVFAWGLTVDVSLAGLIAVVARTAEKPTAPVVVTASGAAPDDGATTEEPAPAPAPAGGSTGGDTAATPPVGGDTAATPPAGPGTAPEGDATADPTPPARGASLRSVE